MKQVSTSIVIHAPPERVWHVLTDFASYPAWNPFVVAISGPLAIGAKLSVRLQPPGGKALSFKPTVLSVEPERQLRWRGRLVLPGLFDGEHHFRLAAVEGGTAFDHGEEFSGLVVRLMGPATFEQTERGFAAMNEALKHRAEV